MQNQSGSIAPEYWLCVDRTGGSAKQEYSCRYKTHEAGHGNARGRPHILILGNRDADDFRTCQDIDMSEQTTAANLDEAIETQMKQSESA